MPPGTVENIHRKMVVQPTLTKPLGKPMISSGSVALTSAREPPFFATKTKVTTIIRIMKQAKKKSVQATVFMPAGITKRILITAMDTISISRGMPVISR